MVAPAMLEHGLAFQSAEGYLRRSSSMVAFLPPGRANVPVKTGLHGAEEPLRSQPPLEYRFSATASDHVELLMIRSSPPARGCP